MGAGRGKDGVSAKRVVSESGQGAIFLRSSLVRGCWVEKDNPLQWPTPPLSIRRSSSGRDEWPRPQVGGKVVSPGIERGTVGCAG
jgi:hypothetical protein